MFLVLGFLLEYLFVVGMFELCKGFDVLLCIYCELFVDDGGLPLFVFVGVFGWGLELDFIGILFEWLILFGY